MVYRLPLWVWMGGFFLSATAGFVNAVGLLGLHHQGLTHVTGQASTLGLATVRGDYHLVFQAAAVILSFLIGAIISGAIIRDTTLQLGRRYSAALLLESLLLFAASLLLAQGYTYGDMLLACAAGLQNAMATTFSGAIVRTTHLTGVVTDLGILLGHALRRRGIEFRKLSLLLAIASGFILGSASGAWAYQHFAYKCLWAPAALVGALGGGYLLYQQYRRASAA